jgi:hypothetical protein
VADIFYTILIAWVLWRIFGSSVKSPVQFRQDQQPPARKEGEVTITSVPKSDQQNANEGGEYVDYEEMKS